MRFDDFPEIQIMKRPDGTWRARFTFESKQWERKGRNKKEAYQRAVKAIQELQAGAYKRNSDVTFHEYFKEWMKSKEEDNVKESTLSDYDRTYRNHIAGSKIDHTKIVQIERREIVSFYRAVGKEKTPYIANRVLLIISMVLRAAAHADIIEMSPCRDIKRLKSDRKPARETNHKALTREELKAFLRAASDSWYCLLFCFMAVTGVRVGEAGALEWGDIDYKNPEYPGGVIYIRNTATKDRAGHVIIGTTTKTKASQRAIPIDPDIKKVIDAQKAWYAKFHGNVWGIHDRIFQKHNGGIVDNNPVNYEIHRIIRKMRAEGTRIHEFSSHAFRDTFATRKANDGTLINVLQHLLGHAKYQTTVDYYVQETPEAKIKAMNDFPVINVECLPFIKAQG